MANEKAQKQNEYLNFDYDIDGEVARFVIDNLTHDKLDEIISAIGGTVVNTYGVASSVASSTPTTVVSYTVPVGKTLLINVIEFSGENIAKYEVDVDAAIEATRRTNFGSDLTGEFSFYRLGIAAGSVVRLIVEHPRPGVADFEGRITGVLL